MPDPTMMYRIQSDEPVSEAVVKAVSDLRGGRSNGGQVLHDVVDQDALDTLFAPAQGSEKSDRRVGSVSFRFRGCDVTIEDGEYLTVEQY